MASYTHHFLSATDRFNYSMITPQYSPDTTIAIKLRQFEKESKAQAETEYDAEHGPMPEQPAEDDESIDIKERTIMKKKRKVRSALVSRKKTAIYEKKLEDELQLSDSNNAFLTTRLSLYRDVLRDIRTKIDTMERTLDARRDAPKRMRTSLPSHHINRLPQQNSLFFPDDNQIADILSFSQEDSRPVSKSAHINDFTTSECSDRQISPMLQPQRPEQHSRDLPCGFPVEEIPWKTYLPQHSQQPVAQMLGASFAM